MDLFLVFLATLCSVLASERQEFWPKSQIYDSPEGERFNCHNVHRKYVTVANGAIGYQGLFHSTEACNQWILPDRKVKLFSNSTELLIGQFVTDDNSTCTVCQLKSSATSYLIYQLLVSEVVPLNFTEKTESPPTDKSPCYTLKAQPIIFNGSVNFTFSCYFTGYPPVQSITWDLGHFNDYECIIYSEDNQTVTFGLSKSLKTDFSNGDAVKCSASNGIHSNDICGQRHLYYTEGYIDGLKFYIPTDSQPSGEVVMNSTGSASFNCSTNKLSSEETMRVCRVDYSKAEECLNRQPERNYTCCSCSYYDPSCPWTVEDGSSTALSSYCTVTTDSRGYYQCEVYDPVINEYQPLGEPIQVVEHRGGINIILILATALGGAALLIKALLIGIKLIICRRQYIKRKKNRSKVEGTHSQKENKTSGGNSSDIENGPSESDPLLRNPQNTDYSSTASRTTPKDSHSNRKKRENEEYKRRMSQLLVDIREEIMIDVLLMAKMKVKEILNDDQHSELISMVNKKKSSKCEKADYFYKVVSDWSVDVCRDKMEKLRVVLEEHSDANNKALARKIQTIHKQPTQE